MHRFRLVFVSALVLGLGACGADEPPVMPDVTGAKLDAALSDIKAAGFDDDPEVLGGGVFGVVVESNWTVCEQEPVANDEITDKPSLTVERSCEEAAGDAAAETTEPPSDDASEEPSTEATPSEEPEANADPVLTAKNNSDFAAILKLGECDKALGAFASEYEGREIAFDGWLAAMAPHGDYDTRFDILVLPGNGPNSLVGPQFHFYDKNLVSDLNLTGKVPDTIGPGQLLRVTAEVDEYNPDNCLFRLQPVETRIR